jgi:hypothetical protein
LHRCLVDIRRDPEVQASSEFYRSQHAHGIFLKAHDRIADCVKLATANVLHAPHPIEDLPRIHIVKERIDGEVTPLRILMGLPENVVRSDQQIIVARLSGGRGIAAKGGRLDHVTAGEQNVNQPEAPPDDA